MDTLWLLLLSSIIFECISQTVPTTRAPTANPTRSPTLQYDEEKDHCKASFNTVSSTYDLCPLTLGGGGQIHYYKVQDSRNLTGYRYEYYFNVGAELKTIPPICQNQMINNYTHQYCPLGKDCTGEGGDINLVDSDNIWSYQVRIPENSSEPDFCWAIGQGPPEWRLLDEEDPSLGLQVTYTNGDFFQCDKNRKFNLQFVCEDNVLFIPDEEPVYEYNSCEYTIAVPSQYGCPIECNIFDNQVCAGQGLCGFDITNDASRCFCYNEYNGDDCATYDADAIVPDGSQKEAPIGFYTFYCTKTNGCAYNKDDVKSDQDVLVTYYLGDFEDTAKGNGGVYIVEDKDFDSSDRKWTYFVSIANPLDPDKSDILPDLCKDATPPCQTIDTETKTCNETGTSNIGFIYQYTNTSTHKECWLLGQFPSAALLDPTENPAKGITVTYNKGSYCESQGINRKLKINLVCPRDNTAIFDPFTETQVVEEYVEEIDTCVYEFTMESAVACPYQCITNTTEESVDETIEEAFTVCSQKGICAADPNAGFVRCLCDSGWKGVYCDERDTEQPTEMPTMAPTTTQIKKGGYVATIVILIIVFLVVVGVGYYIYRNQKIKIQQQASELDGFRALDDGNDANSDKQALTTDKQGNTQFATIQQVDNDDE